MKDVIDPVAPAPSPVFPPVLPPIGDPVIEIPKPDERTAPKKNDIDFGNPLDEEHALFSWKSPERLHKARGREFYTTVGAFVFLLSIITIFFKEFLLMFTIWAFAFVAFVMSRIEPSETEHSLTTRGVKTGKNKYRWGELMRFWFEDKWGQTILHVDTLLGFPRRLIILLGNTPKEQVKEILVKRIPYDKPEDTFVDKATKWLQEKVPLEEETMSRKQETMTGKQTNIPASPITSK